MTGPDEYHERDDTDLVESSQGRFPLFARIGEAVVQVAASAGELLIDKELRRKAGTLVVSEAGKRIKDLQEGVATRAGNIQRGINEGPRQVQSLYTRIQQQYLASRHEASLKARRDMPVDVQVGPFLWEDAPQELRSRLWIALLGNPRLIGNLVEEKALEGRLVHTPEGYSPARSSHSGSNTSQQAFDSAVPATALYANGQPPAAAERFEAEGGCGEAAVDSRGGLSPSSKAEDVEQERESHRQNGGSQERSTPALLHSPNCTEARADSHAENVEDLRNSHSGDEGIAESAEQPGNAARAEQQAESSSGSGAEDAWEIVQAGSSLNDYRGSQLASAQLQPGRRGSAMTLRERLLEAVCEVAWPISTVYPENCRYDTLCQISIGQEEVEEVIQRDINRTFPEHPQFSFEQGQQELFRVLKAYSLHDLQVGYCQGMAFVTGVILMYVPEEPAFRLLTRLMDERGADLRQLYLPGLEGLKNYLRMFEWLMQRLLPELREHLEEFGVVPVLYASQWFLTAFSCPFPTAFSCRVIDVMLTENCGHVMLRVGLAVIKACTDALTELHDFEDLVTYLKVEPVRWSQQKARTVLNDAIEGSISEEMLAAAAEAVAAGYEGSLSRRTSKPEAVAGPGLKDRRNSLKKQVSKGPLAVPSRLPVAEHTDSQHLEASEGDLAEQLASQQADMSADYEQMMIALDALWVGEVDGEEAEA